MINKTATWFSISLITALLLKYLHAISNTGDLLVILQPTSSFVGLFFNTKAIYQDTGFYFPALNILIDKSCSGVNFFIIAFCVFSSTAPYHVLKIRTSILLFVATGVLSYLLTILVNTSRIVSAVLLLQNESAMPWVATPWAHEAEGAFVYLSALLLSYLIVKNCFIKIKNHYAQPASPAMAVIR